MPSHTKLFTPNPAQDQIACLAALVLRLHKAQTCLIV